MGKKWGFFIVVYTILVFMQFFFLVLAILSDNILNRESS